MEEQNLWDAHVPEAAAEIPAGNVCFLDVMATGSPGAVALPESVFNGRRDTRVNVVRESA